MSLIRHHTPQDPLHPSSPCCTYCTPRMRYRETFPGWLSTWLWLQPGLPIVLFAQLRMVKLVTLGPLFGKFSHLPCRRPGLRAHACPLASRAIQIPPTVQGVVGCLPSAFEMVSLEGHGSIVVDVVAYYELG